jgi:hypothetical protein
MGDRLAKYILMSSRSDVEENAILSRSDAVREKFRYVVTLKMHFLRRNPRQKGVIKNAE